MFGYSIWKKFTVCLVVLLGVVFALPNVVTLPSFLPHKKMKLGLDLKGGAYVLLQVDEKAVMKDFYRNLFGVVRKKFSEKGILYKNVRISQDNLSFLLAKQSDVEKVMKWTIGSFKGVFNRRQGLRIIYKLSTSAKTKKLIQTVQQSIEIIRRRIDATGTQEPLIQRQGVDRIVVQLPGSKDPKELKKLLGKTAKMSFYLVDGKVDANVAAQGDVPVGDVLAYNQDGAPIILEDHVYLQGGDLIDSQPSYEQGTPVVSFRFNSAGARKFAGVTTKFVGRRLAIVLDGKVISAPVIEGPILGGSGIIKGNFTIKSANELAILLRAGALPAPLITIEEHTVGPGLGADSIRSGSLASVIGFFSVVAVMVVAYRRFGVYATIALCANLILMVGILTALQATLTLPGIAGIVLTMGMAVDSNVLIFERIREQFSGGSKLYQAVEKGFDRAYTTIFDSNITGLIAAVILYIFGTGAVKGFAVTLSIGILCSMFSAIMITRWLINSWIFKKNPNHLPM